jgi:hypothetical protein
MKAVQDLCDPIHETEASAKAMFIFGTWHEEIESNVDSPDELTTSGCDTAEMGRRTLRRFVALISFLHARTIFPVDIAPTKLLGYLLCSSRCKRVTACNVQLNADRTSTSSSTSSSLYHTLPHGPFRLISGPFHRRRKFLHDLVHHDAYESPIFQSD